MAEDRGGRGAQGPNAVHAGKSRLLDQVGAPLRARHYRRRTEKLYAHWVRRFILYHGKRQPAQMAEMEVNAFLTHLAIDRRLSASTQNQALAALLLLYMHD